MIVRSSFVDHPEILLLFSFGTPWFCHFLHLDDSPQKIYTEKYAAQEFLPLPLSMNLFEVGMQYNSNQCCRKSNWLIESVFPKIGL